MTGEDSRAAHFLAEGYAVFEGALGQDDLEHLRARCMAFIAREDAIMDAQGTDVLGLTRRGRRYFANECQREDPSLRRILFGASLVDICARTLGPDAYFFFDQFVAKGAEDGLPFAWHQDSAYVGRNGGPVEHPPYLTLWCPLDDAVVANGTVRVLPFSRLPASRAGVLPHADDPATGDYVGWSGGGGAVDLEVRAGDVVAFSSLLLHATGANTTNALRRVYLAQYTSAPMLDREGRHLRRNAVPVLRNGVRTTFG